MKIFADSDAYIAIYVPSDPNNLKAEKISSIIEAEDIETYTSWEVLDEVATKLSFRVSKIVAKKFLEDRTNSKDRIYYVNELNFKKVIETFNAQTSKNVSLTDCANMFIARELEIDMFFSFDKHYKQNGFKLLEETM